MVAAPALDLDRVVADGNRRIRRRRGLVVAATAAVVAGAVAIAWSVVRVERSAGPVGTPFRDARPTYSAGSTIHYGNTVVEVGHQITALIQTDTGFVFTTPSAEVFLADGKHVRRIGTTAGRLVADDSGPYVGWTDSDSYVVYDTAARRMVEHDGAGPGSATVVAIDDGNVYLAKADGLHRWNLADKAEDLIAPDVRAEDVFDVAAGRYAILAPPRLTTPGGPLVLVSTDPTADRALVAGTTADVSPDGATTWGTTSSHFVEDVVTAAGSADDVDLLTCSIRAGACSVTQPDIAKLKADGSDPGFRLPNGQLWSGVRG